MVESLEARQLLSSVPNSPFASSAAPAAATSVAVQFYDNSDDETGFVIERATSAAGPFTVVGAPAAAGGRGFRGWTDASAPSGTTSYYRVKAVIGSGDSNYDGPVSATTSGPATVPTVPTAPVPTVPAPEATWKPAGVWLQPNGTLSVWGTPGNNTVTVSHDNSGAYYVITVDANAWQVPGWKVQSLAIDPFAGDDLVKIDESNGPVYQPVTFYGTSGTDTLWGPSTGNATVRGSSNTTYYTNGGANNTIDAGVRVIAPGGTRAPTAPTSPVAPVAPAPPATGPTAYASSNVFSIGVFLQPTYSFDKWKSLGINTLYGYEGLSGTVSMATWTNAAASRGLYVIREPSANPADDKNVGNLMAWLIGGDEPDYHGVDAASLARQAASLDAIDPNRPIIQQLTGGLVLDPPHEAWYAVALKGTDWTSSDVYPVTDWGRPDQLDVSGRVVDRLQSLTGGKRQMAFIEASAQGKPGTRGVTADEFRGEIWNAVVHGATGITYFPQQVVGPFLFDAMTPAVAAEMQAQNARLSRLGPVLMSAADPASLSLSAGGPLEGAWRSYGGKNYYFVLNMSANATYQKITLGGAGGAGGAAVEGEGRAVAISNGATADYFKPYEMHVYVVG